MGYVEKGNKGQGKTGVWTTRKSRQWSEAVQKLGSETGCKSGRTCKFGHDWNALADKDKRCFKCSSLEHMAKDCPTPGKVKSPGGKNSNGSPKGENKNHKGKSKGKDKLDKAGEGAQPQVQHLDASATASTTAPTVGAQQGTQPSTTTTASTAPQGEAVRGEVVNLLKSMRTTPPRVLTVTEMMNNYNGILLDSGARTSFDNLVTRKSGTVLYPQKCRQQLVRPSSGWRRTANLF